MIINKLKSHGIKVFIMLLVFVTVSLSVSLKASAAASTEGGVYFTVLTSQLQKVKIYVPAENRDRWMLIDGLPVSTSGSTVYGYILNSSGDLQYTVRFYSYDDLYNYRLYGSNQNYSSLNPTLYYPKESNINIITLKTDTSLLTVYILLAILGCIPIIVMFRRSK